MRIDLGCRFDYQADVAVPAVTIVEPHSSLRDAVVAERWEGFSSLRYEDLYGNVCRRFTLPPGASSFSYYATVNVSPEPEEMPGPTETQHRIEDLPPSLLHWLLPSRLCDSDTLTEQGWELFGGTPAGAERLYAISDWIHDNIEYGVPSIPTTTASEVLARRGGMCRDFAHLGATFCRTVGIPARYVSGYLPDIGIPGPYPLEDFHAWFEAWLGMRWWTFDARFNIARIGRVPIGRGRDAVDVAMATTYGPASLEQMTVWSREEPDAAPREEEARDDR
jgi:transglutaminase-like putative cysteine protease